MNKEELKRLKWLDNATNNSYGLKNRHALKNSELNQRGRSKKVKNFIEHGEYQDWTIAFSRSSVHWDPHKESPEREIQLV